MSSVDLGTAPLSRLFLRYVTPTVAAMLVTGIYVTIDGIFVGHILGQDGLAGMMLADSPYRWEVGTAELKKIAKYITKSNQESGVAYAIREWVLN